MACENLPQRLWQVTPMVVAKVSLDSEHNVKFDKERTNVSYNMFYYFLEYCWKFVWKGF